MRERGTGKAALAHSMSHPDFSGYDARMVTVCRGHGSRIEYFLSILFLRSAAARQSVSKLGAPPGPPLRDHVSARPIPRPPAPPTSAHEWRFMDGSTLMLTASPSPHDGGRGRSGGGIHCTTPDGGREAAVKAAIASWGSPMFYGRRGGALPWPARGCPSLTGAAPTAWAARWLWWMSDRRRCGGGNGEGGEGGFLGGHGVVVRW